MSDGRPDPSTLPLPEGFSSLEELWFLEGRHQAGSYLTLACAVFLVWEYLITFDEEVRFIWQTKPKISIAKALFYINRYGSLVSCAVRAAITIHPHPSDTICHALLDFTSYMAIINYCSAEIILIFRVWVLYERSRRVAILLGLVFVLGVSSAVAIFRIKVPPYPFLVAVAPLLVSRCPRDPASIYFSTFLIVVIMETIIFGFLVARAWSRSAGSSQTPLFTALLRDGALYYLVVVCSLGFSCIAQTIQYLGIPTMDSDFAIAFAAASCSRLVLSIRRVDSRPRVKDELTAGANPTVQFHHTDIFDGPSHSHWTGGVNDEENYYYDSDPTTSTGVGSSTMAPARRQDDSAGKSRMYDIEMDGLTAR